MSTGSPRVSVQEARAARLGFARLHVRVRLVGRVAAVAQPRLCARHLNGVASRADDGVIPVVLGEQRQSGLAAARRAAARTEARLRVPADTAGVVGVLRVPDVVAGGPLGGTIADQLVPAVRQAAAHAAHWWSESNSGRKSQSPPLPIEENEQPHRGRCGSTLAVISIAVFVVRPSLVFAVTIAQQSRRRRLASGLGDRVHTVSVGSGLVDLLNARPELPLTSRVARLDVLLFVVALLRRGLGFVTVRADQLLLLTVARPVCMPLLTSVQKAGVGVFG